MMQRIGIRELRQHASRYLDLVKTGETVEVTEHGRLIALLVPVKAGASFRDQLIASGRLIPASDPFGPLPDPVPLPPGVDMQAILDDVRADRFL